MGKIDLKEFKKQFETLTEKYAKQAKIANENLPKNYKPNNNAEVANNANPANKAEVKKEEKKITELEKYEAGYQFSLLQNEYTNLYLRKIKFLFEKLIQNQSTEKLKEIEAKLLVDKDVNKYKEQLKKYNELKEDNLKSYFDRIPLLSYPTDIMFGIIDELSDSLTTDEANKLTTEFNNYEPEEFKAKEVHPFEAIINSSKTALNNDNSIDAETKKQYNQLLDNINKYEVRYNSKSTEFFNNVEPLANHVSAAANREYALKKAEDQEFLKVFEKPDAYTLDVKKEAQKDGSAKKYVSNLKLVMSDKAKETLKTIYNKMETYKIIDSENISEQQRKIYGLRRVYLAQNKLEESIKNNDYKNLEQNLKDYKTEIDHVKDIYDIIRTSINPDEYTAPGNMSSFRDGFVPKELRGKDDLFVNATFNGLYYFFSNAKASGIGIDDIINDPLEAVKKIGFQDFEKNIVDGFYPELSNTDRLILLSRVNNMNRIETVRYVSPLLSVETDIDNRKQNALAEFYLQNNYDTSVTNSEENISNYFRNDKSKKMLNIVIAGEKVKFSALSAKEHPSIDGLSIVDAFDTAKYISENIITPDIVASSLINTMNRAYDLKDSTMYQEGRHDSKVFADVKYIARFYNDLKLAAVEYLKIAKDVDLSKVDDLVKFITNPLKLFNFEDKELMDSISKNVMSINELKSIVKENTVSFEQLSKAINDVESNDVLYYAIDIFNERYGTNVSLDLFEKPDLNTKTLDEYYRDNFIKTFNSLLANGKERDGKKYFGNSNLEVNNPKSLRLLAQDIDNLMHHVVNKQDNTINYPFGVNFMTQKERINLYEAAYGVNVIENVKNSNDISYRDLNKKGFNNLTLKEQKAKFNEAKETFYNEFDKFKNLASRKIKINNDSRNAFFNSYREVYQTMYQISKTSRIFKFFTGELGKERDALKQIRLELSNTFKVSDLEIQDFLEKKEPNKFTNLKNDFLYDAKKDFKTEYTFDEALEVSNVIISASKIENVKNEENVINEFDIIMRKETMPKANLEDSKISIEVNELKTDNVINPLAGHGNSNMTLNDRINIIDIEDNDISIDDSENSAMNNSK